MTPHSCLRFFLLFECLHFSFLFVAVSGQPEWPKAKYDYSEVKGTFLLLVNSRCHESDQVLDLSLQFYEAQRSGPLPADNRCGEVRLLILKSILNIAGFPGEATLTLMMRCPEVNMRSENLCIDHL